MSKDLRSRNEVAHKVNDQIKWNHKNLKTWWISCQIYVKYSRNRYANQLKERIKSPIGVNKWNLNLETAKYGISINQFEDKDYWFQDFDWSPFLSSWVFFCTFALRFQGLQRFTLIKNGANALMILAHGPTRYFHIDCWDFFRCRF